MLDIDKKITNHHYSDWFNLYCKEYVELIKNKNYSILSEEFYIFFNTNLLYELISKYYKFLNNLAKERLFSIDPIMSLSFDSLDIEDKKKVFSKYAKEVLIEGKNCFDDKYPLFSKDINHTCTVYTDNVIELLDRLVTNKKEIEKLLLNNNIFTKVIAYKNVGDVHNGMKSTTIIETDNGLIVYHPRDCRIDRWFGSIINKYFSSTIYIPNTLTIDDKYGFTEYINNNSSKTIDEARKYYYNLGSLLSVLNAFDSTDFHFENIMVKDGIYPVIIDIETIIGVERLNNYDFNQFNVDLLHSVMSKMFLPYNIGDNYEVSILYNTSDQNLSMPIIDGKKHDVRNYTNEFYDGFLNTYKIIENIKNELLQYLNEIEDYKVRVIIRPTKNYYQFRNMLYSMPTYYIDEEKRNNLIDSFVRQISVTNSGQFLFIAKEEANSIKDGDIPYLYTKAVNTNLYSRNNCIVENYLLTSAIDNTKRKITSISDAEYQFEKSIMEKNLNNARIIYDDLIDLNYNEKIDLDKNIIDKNIDEIFNMLCNSLITSHNNNKGWLLHNKMSNYELESIGLGTGISGLILFLSSYMKYKKTGNEYIKAKELLDICLDKVFIYIDNITKDKTLPIALINLGMESGIGGILFALCSALPYNDSINKYIVKLIEFAKILNFDNYNDTSYENGILGLIYSMCINDLKDAELITKCINKLDSININKINKNNVLDIALSYKIIKIYNLGHINDEIYKNILNDVRDYDDEKHIFKLKKSYLLEDVISLDLLKFDDFWKDCLYEGKCMIVDILLSNKDVDNASLYIKNIINRKNTNKYYILTKKGIKLRNILSLFNGTIGIGYEMIRLYDSDIKQIF